MPLQSFLKLACVAHCIVFETNALAQQAERTEWPIATEAPGGTITPIQSDTPSPEPRQFAFTFNPLNLIIGRYGFNFEYQPVLHHGLIVTPHYDYSRSGGSDCNGCTDTLNGAGAEFGYRFYSGTHGFDGFFAGPSLLVAKYEVTTTYGQGGSDAFGSIGGAFDVGWQWQPDHFVVGVGAGMQYTKVKYNLGYDPWLNYHAGGGWRPQLAFNLGYAF